MTLRENGNRIVAILLVALLLYSCTMGISGPEALSDRALISRSSRLIELYLEDLENLDSNELESEMPGFEKELEKGFTARDIATRTLEEGGREYLEFCIYADDYADVDEVLTAAEPLIGDEDMSKLREDVERAKQIIYEEGEIASRALTNQERHAFYRDLSKLVIKSVVLLTAAIVYACVPNMMFWGKVSAACAVAVAAGVLAVTIMAIVQYSQTGNSGMAFDQWLEDVSAEPTAAWAIASAMISTNVAMGRTPLLTALIIGVFAIFNVVSEVKTMIDKNK